MNSTSLAVATIVALGPTVAILVTHLLSRRERRAVAEELRDTSAEAAGREEAIAGKIDANGDRLEEVHELVNSRMTEALKRSTALEEALDLEPGEKIP